MKFATMISDKIRKVENLHIVFWLVKDTCWCLLSKKIGVAMIIPTILVALWIVIKTRKNASELAHNLAVLFWISANSTWMCGEFYCNDCARPFALVFFFSGISVLATFYSITIWRRYFQKTT